MPETIPGPKGYPIIGNLLDLQDEVPIHAIERHVDVYGPIYKIKIGANERVIVGGFDIFNELCDETRFWKVPPRSLADDSKKSRAQGLFTASSEREEDWRQAHRILMPAFGPIAIEGMFDEMHDIASQLVLKWARQGHDYKIPVTSDFSRLTLDTIALCAMDFRFNSFYQDELHPFIKAMNNMLASRSNASQISGILKSMLPSYNEQLRKDDEFQVQVSKELVQFRRENPTEKKDLLNAMIYGKDPRTGQTMRDDLIAANMQTFLIAGHETTSGLLSFAFLNMLKNPSTCFAAQQEVDRICSKRKITANHLSQLKYINAVLRETLRLAPTAPAITRGPRPENKEDPVTVSNEKWEIPRSGVLCLLGKVQRDPKVYGDDADEFKPERMLDENFEKLPKNAWKPFGTGMRACIGRAFAWQEALLATALILQNFDVTLDDPAYEMKVVQTLTIKPKDFYMRAKLRPGITATHLQQMLMSLPRSEQQHDIGKAGDTSNGDAARSVTILYGSNTGTCQALAQKLSTRAKQSGYNSTVLEMDAAMGTLPKDQPVVVITASYEGQPCDNATRFIAWLESAKGDKAFAGVKFAVFGCGHKDWVNTFHRIPKLVNAKLGELGGSRIVPMGSTDVFQGTIFDDFDSWVEKDLWPALSPSGAHDELATIPSTVTLELSPQSREAHLQQNLQWADVLEVKQLTSPGQPEKRHIDIELPSGMTYQAGDYLAVLPLNPEDTVKRAIKRLNLPWDGVCTITDAGPSILPVDYPLPLLDLLRGYVELSQPATVKDITILASHASNGSEAEKLNELAHPEKYAATILSNRASIFDLLQKYPSIDLPFNQFLALLPPLKPRQYSISSSPLASPSSCTVTYSVIDTASLSDPSIAFQGVTGSYLKSLKADDKVLVGVRSTNKTFRLPSNPEATPIMMFAAGSGVAPFRGFIQERAVMIREGGRKLAHAVLFLGCRHPDSDALYPAEFKEWEKLGAVEVRYAFSQSPESSEGCKYVQDRMVRDKGLVVEMWDAGAKVYACGSPKVAQEIARAAKGIVKERVKVEGKELSEEQLEEWISKRKGERIVSDVFA